MSAGASGETTTSAGHAGAAGGLETREAIRARDERERDLAVQQRKSRSLSADLNAGKKEYDANQQQQQQSTKREGQVKKEADKVGDAD